MTESVSLGLDRDAVGHHERKIDDVDEIEVARGPLDTCHRPPERRWQEREPARDAAYAGCGKVITLRGARPATR